MSSVPGPRTNPTVKSLANTNQRSLRSWQLTLGLVQTVILAGLLTGSLACAFYLGFYSGQKHGIETALNNNLSTAMRLPIETDVKEPALEDGLQDVYARLNEGKSEYERAALAENTKMAPGAAKQKSTIPEIGSIQTTEDAPLSEALNKNEEEGSSLNTLKKALNNSGGGLADKALKDPLSEASPGTVSINDTKIRVLGEKAAFGFEDVQPGAGKKTLGALMRESVTQDGAEQNGVTEGGNSDAEKSLNVATTNQAVAKSVSGEKPPVEKTTDKKQEDTKSKINKADSKLKSEESQEKVRLANAVQIEAAKQNLKSGSVEKTADKAPQGKETPVKGVSLPKGWFAQIIAPKSLSEAEGMAKKLKDAGFAVVIENAVVRDENYYRVLVGPESSRQHAERLINQLKREPYIKSEPFLRVVK